MAPKKKKSDKGTSNNKREKGYNSQSIQQALTMVINGTTLYKAAKKFNIPWSTLKDYKTKYGSNPLNATKAKFGKPYVLPPNLEVKLVNYINNMQELGFGLTATQVQQIAFKIAENSKIKHPFSQSKKMAGWYWWSQFKKRYNLTLRSPENLSINRAASADRETLNDFYMKLDTLIKENQLENKPERLWNCDETGFMFVTKPGKVVCQVGKKYVYKQTFGERGTTTTVLPCVNAVGTKIPPMIIFKGKRMDPKLRSSDLSCIIKLSPKGWINHDLFYDWFQHFVENLPLARPMLLLMDSHASHLTPEVLELAKKENIIIMTFPAHLTHLLQPLDVGVFRPLKEKWRQELQKYMVDNPGEKPSRYDFLKLFTNAYNTALDSNTVIQNAFRKTGIYPINANAIPDEAIAPSTIMQENINILNTEPLNCSVDDDESFNEIAITEPIAGPSNLNDILKLPKTKEANKAKTKKNQKSSKAKIHTENRRDVNVCGSCNGHFQDDVKAKNGKEWIQCSFCKIWYHTMCQNVMSPTFFLCSNCEMSD